jgi:hypothetical protein
MWQKKLARSRWRITRRERRTNAIELWTGWTPPEETKKRKKN